MVAVAFFVVFAWLVAVTVTVCWVAIVAGAVYTPLALIDPDPLGLIVQATAVLVVFDTFAVKFWIPPPYSTEVCGKTVIETGVRVMVAELLLDVSAWLIAVTVTICGDPMMAGAVYKPELPIVPAPLVGLIDQVTAVFVA